METIIACKCSSSRSTSLPESSLAWRRRRNDFILDCKTHPTSHSDLVWGFWKPNGGLRVWKIRKKEDVCWLLSSKLSNCRPWDVTFRLSSLGYKNGASHALAFRKILLPLLIFPPWSILRRISLVHHSYSNWEVSQDSLPTETQGKNQQDALKKSQNHCFFHVDDVIVSVFSTFKFRS